MFTEVKYFGCYTGHRKVHATIWCQSVLCQTWYRQLCVASVCLLTLLRANSTCCSWSANNSALYSVAVVEVWLLFQQTLGILRVPLHTMEDGDRGFPVFLAGKFIGNSKKQLIATVLKRKIMSPEAVEKAVLRSKQLITSWTLRHPVASSVSYYITRDTFVLHWGFCYFL